MLGNSRTVHFRILCIRFFLHSQIRQFIGDLKKLFSWSTCKKCLQTPRFESPNSRKFMTKISLWSLYHPNSFSFSNTTRFRSLGRFMQRIWIISSCCSSTDHSFSLSKFIFRTSFFVKNTCYYSLTLSCNLRQPSSIEFFICAFSAHGTT